MTSRASSQKKSTTKGPRGCCLRNFAPSSLRPRSHCQSSRSGGSLRSSQGAGAIGERTKQTRHGGPVGLETRELRLTAGTPLPPGEGPGVRESPCCFQSSARDGRPRHDCRVSRVSEARAALEHRPNVDADELRRVVRADAVCPSEAAPAHRASPAARSSPDGSPPPRQRVACATVAAASSGGPAAHVPPTVPNQS